MAIRFAVDHGLPSNDYWADFTALWQNSADRSPFKSPSILKYFAETTNGHLVAFRFFKDDNLHGAILLKEQGGVFTFLSDMKTDVNFIVLHNQCAPEDERLFFEFFFSTIKAQKWSVVLNNQPSWAHYMPAFEKAGRSSGLFWLNLSYSVCPIAEAVTADALFERINSSRELRYRVNKLKKQEHAEFEVLTDGTDLDQWVEEFCQAHILRWADTPTPSAFRDPARRAFVLGCLRAWNADGILIRFAVKVGARRVGFVVGLLEANSLVHHSTTFHPDYWKFSPGKALIHFMAQWMKARNMNVLDFGDGNEPYKYEVANEEHILNRIFLSRKSNVRFILKTRFIEAVRENPVIFQMYQNKIKPLYRNLKLRVSALFFTTLCLNCLECFFFNE